MTLQFQFDQTIKLLQKKGNDFPFVKMLVDNYEISELSFHSFDNPSPGTTKEHLLKIYERRGGYENNSIIGFDSLLPRIRKTIHADICISEFLTNFGTYIIFSDFNRDDLIGVLVSKIPFQESKQKHVNIFKNGILQ